MFFGNSSIYQMITNYYLSSITWMVLVVISILYLIIRADKARREKILLAIAAVFVTVGNSISYKVLIRFFAEASYYRFFWMLPYLMIVSYTFFIICLDIYRSVKLQVWIKVALTLGLGLVLVVSVMAEGSVYVENLRTDRPQNAYMVEKDNLELKEIMDAERATGNCGEMMIMAAPSTIALQYQTVDAGSYMATDRYIYLDVRAVMPDPNTLDYYDAARYFLMALCEDGVRCESELITESVARLNVGYIIVDKKYNLDDYMAQLRYNYVGETTNYTVYRTY